MVLPVLGIYAPQYPGSTAFLVGLALGVYGISQCILQIPFGLISDRIGRKPVIIFGMLLFLAGSLVAAYAETLTGIIIGRALQGSGAVASTVMAMLSDLTREEIRVRAMATIGASIGVSFAVAMIVGPWIASLWGLQVLFVVTAGLALVGIAIVIWVVPSPAVQRVVSSRETLAVPKLLVSTAKHPELLRINLGIFCLHLVQMACWVSVPLLLQQRFDFGIENHWWFYLVTMGSGFLIMVPFIIIAEKFQRMKQVFLGGIATLVMGEALLRLSGESFPLFVAGLVIFFVAFNLLEACLPSLVSKTAPGGTRGTAMGIYSSSQFLGAFMGGSLGGWVAYQFGYSSVFVLSLVFGVLWLLVAWSMNTPKNWSSLVLELLPGEQLDENRLLSEVPGLVDVVLLPEQKLAYLKLDKQLFDIANLETLLGRPLADQPSR